MKKTHTSRPVTATSLTSTSLTSTNQPSTTRDQLTTRSPISTPRPLGISGSLETWEVLVSCGGGAGREIVEVQAGGVFEARGAAAYARTLSPSHALAAAGGSVEVLDAWRKEDRLERESRLARERAGNLGEKGGSTREELVLTAEERAAWGRMAKGGLP